MKKNLLMTAFLVVTTAFIGCSSDENLAELQGGDPVPAKGNPMTVVVADESGDATRYTATNTSTLAGFKMWCWNKTTASEHFTSDFEYTNTVGSNRCFKGDGATWPGGDNTDNPCNLFAIAVNTGSTALGSNFEFDNPAYDNGNLKFTYTMPLKDTDNKENVGLPSGGTVVQTPAIVVDNDNIEDLLVADNMNIKESTTQQLSLLFNHALCGVEISARFTSQEWNTAVTPASPQGTGVDVGGSININYIALHGLYTRGVYNMGTKTWDFSDVDKNEAYYRYAFSTPKTIPAQAVTAANEKIKRYVLVPDNTFLMIPQTIDTWDPSAHIITNTEDEGYDADDPDTWEGETTQGIGAGEADNLGKAYIEINCSFTDVEGFESGVSDSYFLPLRFSGTLEPQKKYKLLINLNNLLYDAGNDGLGTLDQVFGDVIIDA